MKKLLIVEDDPFILDIYKSQFKREGYMVDIAKDGQMALEKIKTTLPDLVLLDIGLPKIDGWQVLAAMRSDAAMKNIKVVVISNNNQQDNAENIIKYNVLKYFLKVEHTATDIIRQVKDILK